MPISNNSVPNRSLNTRQAMTSVPWIICVVAIGLLMLLGMRFRAADSSGINTNLKSSNSESNTAADLDQGSPHPFSVTINPPPPAPRVDTGLKNLDGSPITVACGTCHAGRGPNYQNKSAVDLDEFHTNISVVHGNISCLSCHNENDYDALKLADGTRVAFENVMQLCGQCHGQQMTEYRLGVHGGMNGHWDLTRGPQTKNNCVDCHNPHLPVFPKMIPTFKPKDRFLEATEESHQH